MFARSKSGSVSPQPAPRTSAKPAPAAQCPVEVNKAIIEKATPLHKGDETWQAAIYVPQGGTLPLNHMGRVRTMCIRGPPRVSKEQAGLDAKELNEAVPGGPRAVRNAANQMVYKRVRINTRL